ncbi:hypothetical protein ACVWZK_000191 [Bradyrhizobium sp. GM0.4]
MEVDWDDVSLEVARFFGRKTRERAGATEDREGLLIEHSVA